MSLDRVVQASTRRPADTLPAKPVGPTGGSIVVTVEPDFAFEGEEFTRLRAGAACHAFQSGPWLAALYENVVPALGADPLPVTLREAATGRLLLLLPLLRRRKGRLRIVEFADLGMSDYNQVVYSEADAGRIVADATLSGRLLERLGPCDLVSLGKMPDPDPVLSALFGGAKPIRMRFSTHPLSLGPDWEAWRTGTLSARFRRDLDMKRRKLARKGAADTSLLRDPDEIRESFIALRRFRARRFDELGAPDILADDILFSHYQELAVEGAATGLTRTFRMRCGSDLVGVLFGLAENDRFYYLLAGFDRVAYRSASIGLLLLEDTIRHSILAGDRVYDFTIGDYGFKEQFNTQTLPLYELDLARSLRGRLTIGHRIVSREGKRYLKAILKRRPRLPGLQNARLAALRLGRLIAQADAIRARRIENRPV